MALTEASASIWLLFTQKAAREALKKMRFEILGGKMVRKEYIRVFDETIPCFEKLPEKGIFCRHMMTLMPHMVQCT